MESIVKYIYEQVGNKNLSQQEAKKMLLELQNKKSKHEDIAVIGMACKLPGAKNVDEYWSNLETSKTFIGSVPSKRRADFDHIVQGPAMKLFTGRSLNEIKDEEDLYVKGAFLDEVDKFDAPFFNITPKEATFMDPYQRLFLETAWESIEDAGYNSNDIYKSKTGVFVGRDYSPQSLYKFITEDDSMHLTGSWTGILASRISYIFNLQGPSMVVDTACSSGLTSVHLACESLRNKECDMAIAGGININMQLLKSANSVMDMSMVESDAGVVRTFDKNANGTVWGEGVCVVMLKPLSKAITDRDNIHAVIKGSAINNDGASNGITAPNAEAQEDVILRAWKEADINPETLMYTEAHGTGTVLGDPIEIKGLVNAFNKYTEKKQFCAIGSVKPSIGHTVAASGVAGMIKVILSLKNKKIPASLNFNEPNPYINFLSSPVYVNDRLRDWKRGETPRRGGISSFGFSGTNCYMVLEEAPDKLEETSKDNHRSENILTLSARNENVLRQLIENYNKFLQHQTEDKLEDICYTANVGRGHYFCRLAILVKNLDDLKEKVRWLLSGELKTDESKGVYFGKFKIVSEGKKEREIGEITISNKTQISDEFNKSIRESLTLKLSNKELLTEICRQYSNGVDIDWKIIYKSENRHRISIPVYPLERIRYWANPKDFGEKNNELTTKQLEYPLIDRVLADSMNERIYITELSVDKHWIVQEHRFMGNYVVPGVAYVEWAREACSDYAGSNNISLEDVTFLTPLVVLENEVKEVQTIISKEKDSLKFSIVSKLRTEDNPIDAEWIIHSEGRAYVDMEQSKPQKYDINEIIKKCSRKIDNVDQLVDISTKIGPFDFGGRWYNLAEVYVDENINDTLVLMKLPKQYRSDLEEYYLHPSLLDNAVNIQISTSDVGGVYLPFLYKKLKFFAPMQEEFYSYLRKITKNPKNAETITYNISLMDKEGNVFAEIEQYSTKRMSESDQLKYKGSYGKINSYLVSNWREENIYNDLKQFTRECTVVFKGERDICSRLIDNFVKHGENVIEVEIGSEFKKISENKYEIGTTQMDYDNFINAIRTSGFTRIIHMMTLRDNRELLDIESLKVLQKRGVYSIFYLAKALNKNNINKSIDLILVSDYVNKVTGEETIINPHNATMFGIGKVLREELKNINCRCIDIDEYTSPNSILDQIYSKTNWYCIANRQGKNYVEELTSLEKGSVERTQFHIKKGGVYVITGGTGALGLEVAKHISSLDKVKLILINRSPMPEKDKLIEHINLINDSKLSKKLKDIKQINDSGSLVDCYSVDVSDEQQMRLAFDDIVKKYGNINGIVHAAGVAGKGLMLLKDEEQFNKVLYPKVYGTWILNDITSNMDLDFFVLFSSIVTLFGIQGQSDYTAANCYLDSFSEYGSVLGRRIHSIKWSAWEDMGMAFENNVDKDSGLFRMINSEEALNIFDDIISSDITKVVPAELNFNSIEADVDKNSYIKISSKLEQEINKKINSSRAKKNNLSKRKIVGKVAIRGKSEEELNTIEKELSEVWGSVLGMEEVDLYESFNEMGGDSILATQLLKEIDKVYPEVLDISDIFTYSTIIEMAKYIEDKCNSNKKVLSAKDISSYNEDELLDLLDNLEAGATTIENALEILKDKRG
ncbi:type I polyketide synthase [Clostridium sp. C8-1-8]|uniref:type I polyketide synthase n=1 Tax=Clostridium sp. C8-1-8 TaxID=2698831 RepID=UPI001368DB97|nr:type I polyketide synthase [Clostridium sp. C8-1-8]